MDWVSGCLICQLRLLLLPSPLRPAERSILFSGKSVRLSDDARSAASSHVPKKGCSLREALHVGVAFLLLEPVFAICTAAFAFIEYEYKATSQVNSGSINLTWQRSRRVQ